MDVDEINAYKVLERLEKMSKAYRMTRASKPLPKPIKTPLEPNQIEYLKKKYDKNK